MKKIIFHGANVRLPLLAVLLLLFIGLSPIHAQTGVEPVPGADKRAPATTPEPEFLAMTFAPGLGASFLMTREQEDAAADAFVHGGLHARLTIVQSWWYNRARSNGPSYVELYLETGLFRRLQDQDWGPAWFQYLLGFNLSFETVLRRRFLVPFFGGRWGGMYVDGQGHDVFVEPLLGILFFKTSSMSLAYEAGFLLNAVDLEGLMGVRQGLNLSLSF